MPGMDGFVTAALIRERPRSQQTPIIFITSYAQTGIDALRGYSMGAVDYIFAPVISQALTAKVHVFVDLHRLARQLKSQAEQLAAANREMVAEGVV
jgi:PleD family two-component response regulator